MQAKAPRPEGKTQAIMVEGLHLRIDEVGVICTRD
jgi:hypothetical protein